jgi:hypothetical protein
MMDLFCTESRNRKEQLSGILDVSVPVLRPWYQVIMIDAIIAIAYNHSNVYRSRRLHALPVEQWR